MEQPNYYAILTADVRYSKELNSTEKLLYAEITALCNKVGECWASNEYFAGLYDITERRVRQIVAHLAECGYIGVRLDAGETQEATRRIITVQNKVGLPTAIPLAQEKQKTKEKATRQEFVKPTYKEVEQYCIERKNNIDIAYWFSYYEANGWKVGNRKMTNWKQSILTWERNAKLWGNSIGADTVKTETQNYYRGKVKHG